MVRSRDSNGARGQASGEETESWQLTWLNRGRVAVVENGCFGGRVGPRGLVLPLLVVLVVLDDAAGHLLRVCDRDEVGRVQELVVVRTVEGMKTSGTPRVLRGGWVCMCVLVCVFG